MDTLRTRVAFGYQCKFTDSGWNHFGNWFENTDSNNSASFIWNTVDNKIVLGWEVSISGKTVNEVLCIIYPETYYSFEISRIDGIHFIVRDATTDTLLAEAKTNYHFTPNTCSPPHLEKQAPTDLFILIEYGE